MAPPPYSMGIRLPVAGCNRYAASAGSPFFTKRRYQCRRLLPQRTNIGAIRNAIPATSDAPSNGRPGFTEQPKLETVPTPFEELLLT